MKESEYKKLENRFNALKAEIELMQTIDESAILNAKVALDKA